MTIATKTEKGLLGTKLGMTQVWDETNRLVPVTVIHAGPNVVTQVRDADTDGYAAVQLGYGAIDPRKVTQPLSGDFEKAGVTPRRLVIELRTADAGDYTLGQELGADTFEVGQAVDVTGTTKGKGFAGVMKRHGFKGVSSSHGSHRTTASPARSAGPPRPAASSRACAWPAASAACARRPRTSPSTPWTPRGLLMSRVRPGPPRRGRSRARPRRGHERDVHHRPQGRLPAEIFDVQTNVPLIHQVVVGHSRRPVRARTRRRPGPRSAVAVASRTSRRAPAAPVRARPAPRSSPAVASSTARSRVTTASGPRRR